MGSPSEIAYTIAGEVFEAQRARGETAGDAFAYACRVLRSNLLTATKTTVVPAEAIAIATRVAKAHGIRLADLRDKSRMNDIDKIRAEAAWCIRQRFSGPTAAAVLHRDRTSIISQVQAFEKRLASDDLLRARVMGAAKVAA